METTTKKKGKENCKENGSDEKRKRTAVVGWHCRHHKRRLNELVCLLLLLASFFLRLKRNSALNRLCNQNDTLTTHMQRSRKHTPSNRRTYLGPSEVIAPVLYVVQDESMWRYYCRWCVCVRWRADWCGSPACNERISRLATSLVFHLNSTLNMREANVMMMPKSPPKTKIISEFYSVLECWHSSIRNRQTHCGYGGGSCTLGKRLQSENVWTTRKKGRVFVCGRHGARYTCTLSTHISAPHCQRPWPAEATALLTGEIKM